MTCYCLVEVAADQVDIFEPEGYASLVSVIATDFKGMNLLKSGGKLKDAYLYLNNYKVLEQSDKENIFSFT